MCMRNMADVTADKRIGEANGMSVGTWLYHGKKRPFLRQYVALPEGAKVNDSHILLSAAWLHTTTSRA